MSTSALKIIFRCSEVHILAGISDDFNPPVATESNPTYTLLLVDVIGLQVEVLVIACVSHDLRLAVMVPLDAVILPAAVILPPLTAQVAVRYDELFAPVLIDATLTVPYV